MSGFGRVEPLADATVVHSRIGTLSCRPRLVRYNEPIACVIRFLGEQFGVAALPFARLEVLPQPLQARFGIAVCGHRLPTMRSTL
jgi:hypothetical protein